MFDNPETAKIEAKNLYARTIKAGKWLWSMVPPLHPAGWPFVAVFAVATVLLGILWDGFLVIGTLLTLWCAFFFRNPVRITPTRPDIIVSPADGIISNIASVTLPSELEGDYEGLFYTRISIFLNVFDVHLQRVPVTGKILEVIYRPGKFVNAVLDKASEDNERSTVLMETTTGQKVAFVQIAGLIARRIVNDLKKDQIVSQGELYGLIRFGSRVDVYLPNGMVPLVSVGQRMIGGETVIASINPVDEIVPVIEPVVL